MHAHESQPPGFQPQVGASKPSPLGPRPFEVTFPGQELVAAPTNPFVQRSANSWTTPPATPPALPTPPPEGDTDRADVELDWRPQFSLYAEGQPTAPPPRPWHLQAKLAIGQLNDRYEQEADRIAEQVMTMPDPMDRVQRQSELGSEETKDAAALQTKPLTETITPLIQRQSEDEEIQAKCAACEQEEQAEPIQRLGNGVPQVQPDLEQRLHASKGSGSPLPGDVRSFMEPRFGADFSQVRVHTDSEAVQMNRDLNAQAFTHKQDVYFGSGKAPGKDALTAHELTHVVQQSSSIETNQPYSAYRQRNASIINQPIIQCQGADEAAPQTENAASTPVTWSKGPIFGSPIELPSDEAARRVNQAIDVMGAGLTYVRRPPISSEIAATTVDSSPEDSVQTSSNVNINLSGNGSSRLEKIHGGTVGSIQVCWDCLSGDASLKGWIWAGVGYEMPIVGWVGGYYFGEKTWWKGNLGNWFDPGSCDDKCDANKGEKTESGFGIAGFPIDIKPKQRASFSKGGVEGGFLLTPHSYCDGDIELIALINLLQYLGPVGTVATKAVDGLNAVTKGSPNFKLEAGIDISATFHLCRGTSRLLTVNRANFCGGGFVGAGVGLSHSKTENHGAT